MYINGARNSIFRGIDWDQNGKQWVIGLTLNDKWDGDSWPPNDLLNFPIIFRGGLWGYGNKL